MDERNILQKTYDFTKKAVKWTGGLLKDAFITSPLRTGTSIGLEILNTAFGGGYEEVYIPENRVFQFLFGKDPIKKFRDQLKESTQKGGKLAEKYLGKEYEKFGELGGGLVFLGFSSLDLTPIGGFGKGISKKVLKELAKETNEEAIKKTLKSELPKISDELLNDLAPKIVKVGTTKEVKNILKEAIKQTKIAEGKIVKKAIDDEAVYKTIKENVEKVYPPKDIPYPFKDVDNFRFAKELNGNRALTEASEQIKNELRQGLEEPVKKVSKFWETIKKPEAKFPEEFKELVKEKNPLYEVITNKEMDRKALEYIQEKGVEKAENWLKVASKQDLDMVASIGGRLTQYYAKVGNLDKATQIALETQDLLTKYGRAIEVWKYIAKTSPVFMADAIDRSLIKRLGKGLSQEMKEMIMTRMDEILKLDNPKAKEESIAQLIRDVAKEYPLTFGEKLDIWRYASMLSGPLTHLRNLTWNALNTFLFKPLTDFTKLGWEYLKNPANPELRKIAFSNVKNYYKEMFGSLGLALETARETFKSGMPAEKILDLATTEGFDRAFEAARFEQAGGFLMGINKTILNAMESSDRFFSVLIFNGTKAQLINQAERQGKKITKALLMDIEEKAENIAKRFLARGKLSLSNDEANYINKMLDGIGEMLLKTREVPVLGKISSIFIPFIRTPMNIAKLYVEYSPLGLISKNRTSEDLAKATLGSLVTITAAWLAASGRTTWLPPSDRDSRDAFYAANMKPFSVKIGDNWVPMYYFGPLGFALAMPAAWAWIINERKQTPSDDLLKAMTIATIEPFRFIVSQTPLQGFNNFMRALSGDIDVTVGNAIGFTLEQFLPLNSFVRWVNKFMDPVYRKAQTPIEQFMKDMPFFSKMLEPYVDPVSGGEARRNWTDMFLPYPIGKSQPFFEESYKQMQQSRRQAERLKNEAKKEAERVFKVLKEQGTQAFNEELYKLEERNEDFKEKFVYYFKQLDLEDKLKQYGLEPTIKQMPVKERAIYLDAVFQTIKERQGEEALDEAMATLEELGVLTEEVVEEIIKFKESRQLIGVQQ